MVYYSYFYILSQLNSVFNESETYFSLILSDINPAIPTMKKYFYARTGNWEKSNKLKNACATT